MQVFFLHFFIFFSQLSYIDMGVEFMSHIIHYVTTNFKKSFILSAQRLSPAFKAQLCILSWSLPFSEH